MQHPVGRRLAGSERPLCQRYDTVMLDLDGVVYVGPDPVPGAAEWIEAVRAAGLRHAFVTNNAARTPADVAAHLRELGVDADATDVVTSAQAAARVLRELVPAGSAVLTVGDDGLVAALTEQGMRPVSRFDDEPAAVVQGFGPDVGWRALAEAVAAVDAGLPWVASNVDATLPTPRGRAPGNGALVDVVARTTGRRPRVAGKSEPALFEETALRVGGDRPIVVGDRLDTDIEGAVAYGVDSLLVLTGVTNVADLCGARSGSRPTYVSSGLGGLLRTHPAVQVSAVGSRTAAGVSASCHRWSGRVTAATRTGDAQVSLTGSGDHDDAVRALVSACWAYADASGRPVGAEAADTAWQQARPRVSTATVGQRTP